MSIGEDLAAARSRAGLTVADISQRTRIKQSVINAIESDDFSGCGGDFYARGDIRAIARAVGADPEPIIRDYDQVHPAPQDRAAADLFRPVSPVKLGERRRLNWSIVLVLALLVVVGIAAYLFISGAVRTHGGTSAAARHHPPPTGAPSVPPASPHSASPHSASPQPASPQPASGLLVRLTATQACWVEFTTPTGGFLFQSYVVSGTSKTWTFHRAVHMILGNPGGVTLTVNGAHPLPPGTAHPVTLDLRPGSH